MGFGFLPLPLSHGENSLSLSVPICKMEFSEVVLRLIQMRRLKHFGRCPPTPRIIIKNNL